MKKQILKTFLKYIIPYWKKELALFVLIFVNSAGSLASPYILKILIDQVFPHHDFHLLISVLEILVGTYILRIISTVGSDYLYAWISNHIVMDIRASLFAHLIRIPLPFYNENKTGEIVHKINNEVDKIQSVLTNSIVRFFNNFFSVAGLVFMLVLLNYKLFFISALIFPFVFLNMRYFTPRIRKTYESVAAQEADLLNYFSEKLGNVKLIKIFNTYGFELSKLKHKIDHAIKLNLKVTLTSSVSRNLSTFLVALGPVLVFWWGGQDVLINAMSLGSLVAFLQYLNRLYGPSTDLMNLHTDLLRAFVSMERIYDLFQQPIISEENNTCSTFIPEIQFITFRQISFRYDNKLIIDHLDLKLEAGRKYAFVGESGCGKTSIINLLCQFLAPTDGTISLNDELDIKNINPNKWMDRIALVSQENQIFHGSIKENMEYGTRDGDDNSERIIYLSKLLDLHSHITQLEDGYDWTIGDKGVKFSGGQKQIVAIIRSLLKNAEILILDEATSALDSIKEKLIFETIAALNDKKIIILISHRISTIRNVDEIICFKDGRIIEQGRHQALVNRNGYYCCLFKNQLEEADSTHPAVV